ncbi:E3 ubiquitin/ISG15 ligase TRIM25-like [Clarias gariepinus]|uniref:E3 ubiquitin/ISG15 ligase TRIM25-like n=1 Tax=Clarias gariepinus TaxID=13013 RepID=UPI00234D7CD9|nr:E3 ubiquitin/ISG15 ligase TRIM25-like [Clarias gariepinus]
MADADISVTREQLNCSICHDLLRDPGTLLCGHSFCMECINSYWNQNDEKGVYSCPHCRQSFAPRPVVSKNIVLADVVETIQATPPAQSSAGSVYVECDSCTEKKQKAIKSCLVCLASFCETHLQPHYKSPAYKTHNLVEASRRLQDKICSQHGKLLEVYCRIDQQCICMLCMLDEHKGHDTVSAAAERSEKQKQLLETQKKNKQKILDREKKLQELRKTVETQKRSAQTAVQKMEKIFTELKKSIEGRLTELTKLIRDQEKAAVSQTEETIKKLEEEIANLKQRDTKMEELLHTEDSIQYLQSFQSVSNPVRPLNLATITSCPVVTFENVIKCVSQLKGKVEEYSKSECEKISRVGTLSVLESRAAHACGVGLSNSARQDGTQQQPSSPLKTKMIKGVKEEHKDNVKPLDSFSAFPRSSNVHASAVLFHSYSRIQPPTMTGYCTQQPSPYSRPPSDTEKATFSQPKKDPNF